MIRPNKSFLLLGPRGTGKSTWLRQQHFDLVIDLLKTRERLTYERDPGELAKVAANLPKSAWILIDEVQKVPELLDEVHRLYEERRFNFALSGSSARKLKRTGVNLLGGRAIARRMYPLTYPEYSTGNLALDALVDWGTLPLLLDNFEHKEDTLETYVDTYLRQELLEEGIVRKIEPFSRFLQVAGLLNGQLLNVENVAREAKVKRPTVDSYFQVLIDTLIGFKLPAYQPHLRINEGTHPKFYFFDPGVARAAAGLTREDLDSSYRGFLYETWLLGEIRAYNDLAQKHRDLFHYTLRGGGDIDLIVQLKKSTAKSRDDVIAIEFKLGRRWRPDWAQQLTLFDRDRRHTIARRKLIVYTGTEKQNFGGIELLPVFDFLAQLHAGEIF